MSTAESRLLWFAGYRDLYLNSSRSSFKTPPAPLFQARIVGGGGNQNKQQYTVSADGRFLINVPFGDSATAPITLILNWKPKQ